MICPGCSTPNQDDFKFCRECGQRLAAALPPAASGSPVAAPASRAPAAAAPSATLDEAVQAGRLLDQAFDLYDEARYQEALGACQAALALDPSGSTAHSLLGMIYERLGKTAEAVQQYQIVLRMNPDSIADATRLDSLLGQRSSRRAAASLTSLFQGRRWPAVAGGAAAAVALVAGFWVTARAVGQGPPGGSATARAARGPIPGASMPRSPAPTMGMPGAEEALPPAQRGPAPLAQTTTVPGSAVPPNGSLPNGAVPQPPPATAWPGLRGAYPPAPPLARYPQNAGNMPSSAGLRLGGHRGTRPDVNGYLPPAPIQDVERLNPNGPSGFSPVPGSSLPTFPGAGAPMARRPARGAAPVLPLVTAPQNQRPVSAAPALQQPVVVPQPPPSASISIQPLDEPEPADATRGAQQSAAPAQRSAAPQPRTVTLGEALRHQQMAAYYKRQGDDQAAYGEYQYARDMFRAVQQRGGREGAVAREGAAAALLGMSRLQGQ